jgi:hypothetical protein
MIVVLIIHHLIVIFRIWYTIDFLRSICCFISLIFHCLVLVFWSIHIIKNICHSSTTRRALFVMWFCLIIKSINHVIILAIKSTFTFLLYTRNWILIIECRILVFMIRFSMWSHSLVNEICVINRLFIWNIWLLFIIGALKCNCLWLTIIRIHGLILFLWWELCH